MESNYQDRTLDEVAALLEAREVTSEQLVMSCLETIQRDRQRSSIFTRVDERRALDDARAQDDLRSRGEHHSPFAGIPISIKDLFDYKGEVTTAGTRVLENRAPADRTAPAIRRLEEAGFVVLGRSNMSELAYSGLGMNPHFGTPAGFWRRDEKRIPGGSSSGAAVSVAAAMAFGAIGTDTGGSCRIPAAFNGLVGFKPTARSVPTIGAVPLSPSLDSIGPIARSVGCCANLWQIMSGDRRRAANENAKPAFLVPEGLLLEGVDPVVAASFERALSVIGGQVGPVRCVAAPLFERIAQFSQTGGLPAVESYALYKAFAEDPAAEMDPHVRNRILRGSRFSRAAVDEILRFREAVKNDYEELLTSRSFLLCPTVAIIPPTIDEMKDEKENARVNALTLRNTSPINFVDGCAISIPMHAPDEPVCGLMIAGGNGRDHALLSVAALVETAMK